MNTFTRVALGLGAAAVVASGGSALTAANDNTSVASDELGYGSVTVTGVTVKNIAYNINPADSSLLATVVFKVTENINDTDYDAVLGINGTATSNQRSCAIGTYSPTAPIGTDITCTATDAVATVTTVHLTVKTTSASL